MQLFHTNNNGVSGQCHAKSGNCPFGSLEEHSSSIEEARKSYETSMSSETLTSVQKELEFTEISNTYQFPIDRLEEAVKSVERINRRAEKNGIIEKFSYEVEEYDKVTENNGYKTFERYARFTLDRPSLQHDGWTFAGTMSWDEEVGLVTRLVPGQKLSEPPKAKLCDVCKKKRHRTDTYIVKKGNEQKQVGSNCLQPFMGLKPNNLWMLEYEIDLKETPSNEKSWGRSSDRRHDSKEMIGLGLAVTETYGWTSRAASNEYHPATIDRVTEVLYPGNIVTEAERKEFDRLMSRGHQLEKEAQGVIKTAQDIEGDSDYAQNLKTVLSGETISMRNLPLALSAIGHAERLKNKKREESVKKTSEHVGVKGEKLSFKKVTLDSVKEIESDYGYGTTFSTLAKFTDENGNSFKTFYSGQKELEEGKSYQITVGTIKDHDEWQGAKETILTRVKFESVRPDTQPPTNLSKDSVFGSAWTIEESHKIYAKEMSKNKAAIKKKALKSGIEWDKSWDKPKDSELVKEWDSMDRVTQKESEARNTELLEFESNE